MNHWTLDYKIKSFFYQRIIRPMALLSKLGRSSIMGRANSGLSFDHMYRNKPKGIAPFGQFVDRVLLNLPSVKATRNRKEILIKILKNEIANNSMLCKKTKIVDAASGPARYLSELINSYNQDKIEVLCLDRDIRSLKFGKILAGRKPIRFVRANILKANKLKKLSSKVSWKPNIILSSGLFEYLDGKEAQHILADVYESLENGGLFIFATQKDNPSKELMKEVCLAQNGKPWELIYRDPELLRKWIIDAGFRSVIISVDRWGMYEFCTGWK